LTEIKHYTKNNLLHKLKTLVLLLTVLQIGCSRISLQNEGANIKTINDIAYSLSSKVECIVYIKENGELKPYIVITSDYSGNALLLRKHILDETQPFKHNNAHMWANSDYAGYYEDSSIDRYLNDIFLKYLDEVVQEKIIESDVEITAKSSLGITGEESIFIKRKVFLLSAKELDAPHSRASVTEGKPLKFFTDDSNRRAAWFSDGEACPYWTRTPETWETYTVFTIGKTGIGSASVDVESGVRPAFCIDPSTLLLQVIDENSGQMVYALDMVT
jgi:hypothetical protein